MLKEKKMLVSISKINGFTYRDSGLFLTIIKIIHAYIYIHILILSAFVLNVKYDIKIQWDISLKQ